MHKLYRRSLAFEGLQKRQFSGMLDIFLTLIHLLSKFFAAGRSSNKEVCV